MTIDNIFAIILLPLLGALSDQTRTRFGRRMPYILIGAPLAALTFSLIPLTRSWHVLWLMMLNIIFMNFFMALFRSPVIALMPDITPPEKRSQANGVINFMGGVGALLAYLVVNHSTMQILVYHSTWVPFSCSLLVCLLLPL